jgi:arsenite-transporting ATPase
MSFMDSTSTPLIQDLKRINLISGKGGVGRTTLTAALAKSNAAQGKKTLIAELEDDSGWDSPLARVFGVHHFPIEPQELAPNLHGICLSAHAGQEQFLTSFLRLPSLAHAVLNNSGIKWFLEGAPAFREMGFFNHLLQELKKDYDTILLDLPATGHMVGLAKLPKILLKMIPVGPIADRLKEGQKLFYDKSQTAAWVVTLPQSLPVSEAIELKRELMNEDIPFGGFVLNRAPFNPFTPEEEQVLESLSQKSQTLERMVDLERLRRFRDAKKRLEVEAAHPGSSKLFVVPETIDPLANQDFGLQVTQAC